jgi:uncharacterized protein YndB with AHSA1/START domain
MVATFKAKPQGVGPCPTNSRSAGRIAKPVAEVFEAVADPTKLSGYFTTGGAQGRLETGATVTWDFHDFPGAFPVEVVEVVARTRRSSCAGARPSRARPTRPR